MWGERLYLLDAQSQRNLDNLKKKSFSVITLEKPKDNKDLYLIKDSHKLMLSNAYQRLVKPWIGFWEHSHVFFFN